MMLLAVDIGNSNIVFGIFKGARLVEKRFMPTNLISSFSKVNREIYKLPHRDKINGIIVSSVVPAALAQLEKALKRVFKKCVYVLGRDMETPIKNLYRRPEQVGQDRLVNGVAASALYNKKNKRTLVIVDFGTAVTFDVISKKDEYLGGIIFPGIRLSLENLWQRAALLPKIEIKRPASLIGRDTKESMRSGILNGYASLCEGIVGRISSLFRNDTRVIATGGDAPLIVKNADFIERIDLDLTLKGLSIIYNNLKGVNDYAKKRP